MIDRLVDAVGRAAAWLNVGMVAATCVVVTLRYAFDTGAIFLQESVVYLHGFGFLLGLSYALKHDAHVRVDVFYSRFRPGVRAAVNLVGHLLLLMPLAVVVVFTSWGYVAESWAVLEGSPEVGGIPGVFVLKTAIPAAAVLLFVQSAALAWAEWRKLGGHA